MRVLLLGAAGFIGRHLLSALNAAGHEVTCIVRQANGLDAAYPEATFHSIDLADMNEASKWGMYLSDTDIVINAVGILRGSDMKAIHVDMPSALHQACEIADVQRVILLSAISARPEVQTDYSQSKLAGEESLRKSALRWTILRPSLVYGEGSYGGTSLIRGLSGLPWIIPQPGDGNYLFTPIHVDDLSKTIVMLCQGSGAENRALEPVGPETLSLADILAHYRKWLGFGDSLTLKIPMPVMWLFARLGDLFGRGPVSTNSLKQMVAGNTGDSEKFQSEVDFRLRSLEEALREQPAQVQDRWHARLFFLVPVLKFALVVTWVLSAIVGLLFGETQTREVLASLDLPSSLTWPLQFGTAILDLSIAALLVFENGTRWSTIIQLVVVAGYTLVISLALPELWLDPLGPLLKNLPIIAAILVYGAIGSRR